MASLGCPQKKQSCERKTKCVFTVGSSRKYDGRFPSFRRPVLCGHFSINPEREFREDLSQLKHVFPQRSARVHFDLKHGYKQAIKKDETVLKNENLNHVLRWILQNLKELVQTGTPSDDMKLSLSIDFVCFRGLLTRIMCTPYEQQECWIICATRFKGTIYLCAFETEETKMRLENMSERDKEFSSWGFKFEQYMLTDKVHIPPNTDVPVNENEEFCCMFKSKLNMHSMLYGAEMDGLDEGCPIPKTKQDWSNAKFVELKTSRELEFEKQERNFRRYKLIKWWTQCFIVGIDNIICGFRDDTGVVRRLETYPVSSLPKLAKELWYPTVCANFCDQLLQFIKDVVTEDDISGVWKFEWKPRQDVTATWIQGDSEFMFLPFWYIETMNKATVCA